MVILALGSFAASIRIVREYERVVVFRLGHLREARGPGLVLILPVIERTRRVNPQVDTTDIRPGAVYRAGASEARGTTRI